MNNTDLRAIERASIYEFVSKHDVYLTGRVLDYGCGTPATCVQPQPYRPLVEAVHARMRAGAYVPYEQGDRWPEGQFDCVLMTQVLQYIPNPTRVLYELRGCSHHLLMTYPTHWPEVESADLWRFTKRGVEKMLHDAGWEIETHIERWSLPFDGFKLIGGYGVVAR